VGDPVTDGVGDADAVLLGTAVLEAVADAVRLAVAVPVGVVVVVAVAVAGVGGGPATHAAVRSGAETRPSWLGSHAAPPPNRPSSTAATRCAGSGAAQRSPPCAAVATTRSTAKHPLPSPRTALRGPRQALIERSGRQPRAG